MHEALSAVWWTSALGGAAAAVTAAVTPRHRRPALVAAAVLFTVAGILGVLSVGILFLAAAVACAIAANRSRSGADRTSDAV